MGYALGVLDSQRLQFELGSGTDDAVADRTGRGRPERTEQDTGATQVWDGMWYRARHPAVSLAGPITYGARRRSGGMDQATAPGRLNEVETLGVITPISGRRPRDRSTTEGRPSTGGIQDEWAYERRRAIELGGEEQEEHNRHPEERPAGAQGVDHHRRTCGSPSTRAWSIWAANRRQSQSNFWRGSGRVRD